MTAPQMTAATDAQAVITMLRAERDAALAREATIAKALATRTAELATRNSEYGEQIEHQLATVDVLSAMSESPADPQPVFVLITRHASECCNSRAVLWEFDGTLMHFRASHGAGYDMEAQEAIIHQFPAPPDRGVISARAVLEQRLIHIADATEDPEIWPLLIANGARSYAATPLMRDGKAIGAISMNSSVAGGFSDSQIELLKTFAEQAVIAITSAETYRALQTRTNDLQESLKYQTATSEMLKLISRSTFDLQPVLETVAATAARLCDAEQALIGQREGGDLIRLVANFGFPPEAWAHWMAQGATPLESVKTGVGPRTLLEGRIVHIHDVAVESAYPVENITLARQRTTLGVPLQRDGETVGCIVLARRRVEPFTDRQIDLISTFADQAVIAIENTRLITEQREALEQQTATAEVLQVVNASPGDLRPVFDTMLEKAMRLCAGTIGGIFTFDGDHSVTSAMRGVTAAFAQYNDKYPMDKIQPGTMPARIIATRGPVQNADLAAGEPYRAGHLYARALVELGGIRAVLAVPLLRDGVAVGMVAIYRQEVGAFSNKQIALLENFAAQAVIAMENARLITEQREALEQQTATAEVLQVINASPGNLTPVFDAMLEKATRLCDSSFGTLVTYDGDSFNHVAMLGVPPVLAEFMRSPLRPTPGMTLYRVVHGEDVVHVEDITKDVLYLSGIPARRAIAELGGARTQLLVALRKDDTLLGVFNIFRQEVRLFSDQQIALLQNFAAQAVIAMENARLLGELRNALDAAQSTLRELKAAQANLIQAEKMASLGQLTAGIAHEIKNPLNFVNNFAALSVDLLSELKETAAPGFAALTDDQRADIDDVSAMLTSNLEKITEHGKRADGIVKAMLEHSRGSSAERRMVDLNTLIDEALNLAYHGARAQDQSFNISLERNFGAGIAQIEVNPQDMTRVFLNIFGNGFYAATRRARHGGDTGFVPMLKVTTRDAGEVVEIRVQDNGTGIPADIRDKLFQPFFTTKPAGEGTGLGLSITYDIVTKQHGGTITVDSEVDAFTEFVVTLPRKMFASEGGPA